MPQPATKRSARVRDVVVRCSGARHRVRLARGLRFWKGARCPVCRAAVDPTRMRRVGRWIANLRRPRARGPGARAVWWSVLAYLLLAAGSAAVLWGFSDRWWPATLLLFGPRWILLLPLPLLVAVVWRWDRALLAPLVVAAWIVVSPVMGHRTGWRALLGSPAEGSIRIATWNVAGGDRVTKGPVEQMFAWRADVGVFQECWGAFRELLLQASDWHTDARGRLCLISRFPIEESRVMERDAIEAAGGSGQVATYRLRDGSRSIQLTNLHLETPRAGFELFRAGRLQEAIPTIREKSVLRRIELRRARAWVDDLEGPHLVAGDFNTPPESRSYREAWGDWPNAFSVAGRGLGGTRLNGWIRARIDHVLADPGWRVLGAEVRDAEGSDHRPVIAELLLR